MIEYLLLEDTHPIACWHVRDAARDLRDPAIRHPSNPLALSRRCVVDG